ncbi:hypothetical protein D3Z62_27455 [Lachnospiraceae bacterium]|jgi:multidrug resistance efflux pump|nr:hypothetical protein [uncultured Schaedlerella sp.]MCI8768460.1 hypothetical protein [Ruminococcus sp.]NBJ03716.1 hypothetical protein [Lachnospiraceae bacterium]
MKQRIRKAGILLLGLMILFTIISRTAYNMSTAEVSTERAERQTFTPDVSARGTVTGSREIAVSTVENLRVGTVRVMEGQAVDAGEILFEVDLQDLTEKMKEKRQELEVLDLQIRGTAESEAVEEASRQLSRFQAQEDYNRTAGRENAAVDAALAELQKAQEEYQNFTAESAGNAGQAEEGQPSPGQPGSDQSSPGQSGSGQPSSGQSSPGQSDPGQPSPGQLSPSQSSPDQTGEQLLAAVQEKQAAYDQALQNREDSLYNAQKSLDSANLGTAKSYSLEQSRITRGQKEEEAAKLQALLDVQGRVAAPVKGMVTGVSVRAGTTTTGGGDILLSDLSGGASLTVTFPEELRKYIREGAQAVVTAENGRNDLQGMPGTGGNGAQSGEAEAGSQEIMPGASQTMGQNGQQRFSDRVTIRTVADSTLPGNGASDTGMSGSGAAGSSTGDTAGGSFTVTVDLPPEHFTAGETAILKVEVRSGDYDTCIPAAALHLREKDQYYVNVAEKRSVILGEEWAVRQVDVELLEKNEKYAAVEGISPEQEIVTEASRTLEDGSRVKMKNET